MSAKFLNIKVKKGGAKKRGKGSDLDEKPTNKGERIEKDNQSFMDRAAAELDPVAVDRIARSKALAQRNRHLSSKHREEKRAELVEMQQAGFFPSDELAKTLDTEERRREVFKLHLRGYDQTQMSEIFGVHRQTIVKDMKLVRQKLVAELTSLGAEGLVTQSFSMYELLQHEAIKRLDLLPITDKKAIPLIRLVKDLEDSKVKLLSTIGALKPRAIQGAERIAKGDTVVTPEVRTGDLLSVLGKIGERYKAEIIEGEVSTNDDQESQD
ncbi:hypothetical protein VpasPP24_90 [Vibrio phage Vpas_PP24]|nr:hypothetical protein VpasPP24_90 [Vibrio phage Vpas_PP24]